MAAYLKPLPEQTIVITGASSGIGLATARRAADRGARVILVSRGERDLQKIKSEIESHGGRADFVVADMGRRADVRRVVETVLARHGGFDTWVNNAGVGAYARLEEITDEDHERLFQTNYWGVVYGATEALKHLKPRGGAVINIGSIASTLPTPLLSAYSASKHAVKGFTDSLRIELQHEGAPVSVTLVEPSSIDTPFARHAMNYMDRAAKMPPPTYHPDEVAKVVLRAAEVPTRNVIVGGVGAMQTAFNALLPALADRIIGAVFYATARDPDHPPHEGSGGFHRTGDGGDELGDQPEVRRSTSLYNRMRLHPAATFGVAAAAAGLVLATFARGRR